jgi:uncharacterized membrane protein YkvI
MFEVEGCSVAAGKHQHFMAFQIGCTYIGTVVGAGFASGQEVLQFFGRFGNWGYLAIFVTTFLFAWLGYRLLQLGHDLKAYTYRDVNEYLFGRRVGAFIDVVMMIMLFGVTVAMIAGAGELFRERAHLSFQLGAIVMMVVTFLTILRGIDGIMKANTIIVPIMVSFVLFAAFHALYTHGIAQVWQAGAIGLGGHPILTGISAILYSALNIGLAAGVLIPLGASVTDRKVLKRGAEMGALGLGMMLTAVMFTLLAHYPNVLSFAVPMGYVASRLGPSVQWLFVVVLWGEIYSTLVGNVFAIGTQFDQRFPRQREIIFAITLLLAYAVSQVGFTNIVTYAYTAFGWVCMLLLMALLWPRTR